MPKSRPIGVFDLTVRCPLRCQHCYMNLGKRGCKDLPDKLFLQRLSEQKQKYGIRSAFWVGGEPLLRPKLLMEAMASFERNAVATSGTVSIPPDLTERAGLLVSVEGPQSFHDQLRGSGNFERTRKRLSALKRGSFALSTTLCQTNAEAIELLPSLCDDLGALGVLIGFYVGQTGDPLRVEGEKRNRAIDRLLDLKRRNPEILLNTTESLEKFRPGFVMGQDCIYSHTAIAFDHRLKEKKPCTFGTEADCALCGCPVVALQSSRQAGEAESLFVLRQLFPRHKTPTETEHMGGR